MFSRSGYQALPLGDFDRFQQSSIGLYGAQKGFFSFGAKADPLGPAMNAADSSQGWLSWICHGIITSLVFLLMLLTFPISGWFALKIVPTYERMIIFRLGRLRAPQGPGVVLLLPFIDHWQRVDLRTRAFNVPPCKGWCGALHGCRRAVPCVGPRAVCAGGEGPRGSHSHDSTERHGQGLGQEEPAGDPGGEATHRGAAAAGHQRHDQVLGAGGGPCGADDGGGAAAPPGRPAGTSGCRSPGAGGLSPPAGCPPPQQHTQRPGGSRQRGDSERGGAPQEEAQRGRAALSCGAHPLRGSGEPGGSILPGGHHPARRRPQHLLHRPLLRQRAGWLRCAPGQP
eukprot:XP_015134299.1 stomatin-like protein 1 isoform X2 [Gallus gallus]